MSTDLPDELNERMTELLSRVRIDEYKPWRYMFFVFLAGIARGIGFALGMTIILAILVFVMSKILATLVNFPLVGSYFQELSDLIQVYLKSGVRIR
ncbi:MAG: hypothetical protein HQ564_01785 [Candidatus Saganbacteria bacterium]|nr:hypothetical protein [Candidatus Saganbacteria bacterium]